MLVVGGMALSGCGGAEGRVYLDADAAVLHAVYGARDVAQLEELLRTWLEMLHMRPKDIDCMVAKVKASPYWHPDVLVFDVEDGGIRFAQECGVDVSKLWYPEGKGAMGLGDVSQDDR